MENTNGASPRNSDKTMPYSSEQTSKGEWRKHTESRHPAAKTVQIKSIIIEQHFPKICFDASYQFCDIWLAALMLSHMRSVRSRPCNSLRESTLSIRFRHSALIYCGLPSRILSCRCYVGTMIYRIKLLHPIFAFGFLYSVNWGVQSFVASEANGTHVRSQTSNFSAEAYPALRFSTTVLHICQES